MALKMSDQGEVGLLQVQRPERFDKQKHKME